jgi:hypothetical protein
MACKRCPSKTQRKFSAEMNIHFPGREGLDKSSVWLFPEITVCLDCGFTEFYVPKAELRKLKEDDAA